MKSTTEPEKLNCQFYFFTKKKNQKITVDTHMCLVENRAIQESVIPHYSTDDVKSGLRKSLFGHLISVPNIFH